MREWLEETQSILEQSWGLNSNLAYKTAILIYWAYVYGGFQVTITSGWRDPKKQAAMRARWDEGNREGMVARPAKSSKHTVTTFFNNPDSLAVDLTADLKSNLHLLGEWATKYLDLKWGGYFKSPDLVHFYV